jgi:hypothetical protein
MQYERITDSPRSTDCCLKAVERVLVDVRILLAMLLNRIQRIQQTKVFDGVFAIGLVRLTAL